MPKKTESTGTGLESYVAKLMGNGSNRTSVTEDEIQVALKDIDVSDEQLNAVYSALRNSGIQIISASGNDDAPYNWQVSEASEFTIPRGRRKTDHYGWPKNVADGECCATRFRNPD